MLSYITVLLELSVGIHVFWQLFGSHGAHRPPAMLMTDEEAAQIAISSLDTLSKEQQEAQAKILTIIASEEPIVDIHDLFSLYNALYFRSLLLPRVEVSWSSRLTLCAGICELVRDPNNGNKYTRVRLKLSEPLLRYRPRSDVLDTLLHESIHAYFFITTSWRHVRGSDTEPGEDSGHGAGFQILASAINDHGGYDISIYHTFHDEVDSYRTHIWQCDGPCRSQAPFFGQVKRSMNRAPGKSDSWWSRHVEECGGTFVKVGKPELSSKQLERLRGLERAGRQKRKIDSWVVKSDVGKGKRGADEVDRSEGETKRVCESVLCPICEESVRQESINEHLDIKHPP